MNGYGVSHRRPCLQPVRIYHRSGEFLLKLLPPEINGLDHIHPVQVHFCHNLPPGGGFGNLGASPEPHVGPASGYGADRFHPRLLLHPIAHLQYQPVGFVYICTQGHSNVNGKFLPVGHGKKLHRSKGNQSIGQSSHGHPYETCAQWTPEHSGHKAGGVPTGQAVKLLTQKSGRFLFFPCFPGVPLLVPVAKDGDNRQGHDHGGNHGQCDNYRNGFYKLTGITF